MTDLHPPYKRDKITPEQAYADGAAVGRGWTDSYRPGGPWVPQATGCGHDIDWIAYCERKSECNRAWLRGFDEAPYCLGTSSLAKPKPQSPP